MFAAIVSFSQRHWQTHLIFCVDIDLWQVHICNVKVWSSSRAFSAVPITEAYDIAERVPFHWFSWIDSCKWSPICMLKEEKHQISKKTSRKLNRVFANDEIYCPVCLNTPICMGRFIKKWMVWCAGWMVRKLDINNLEIPGSKPLWISEGKLAFHSSKVDHLRPTTPVAHWMKVSLLLVVAL